MTKLVEVRPDLFVELAPLTIRDAMKADVIVGKQVGDNPTEASMALLTSKIYTICAIRKIGFSPDALIPVAPLAGDAAFDGVADRFSLRELNVTLATAYSELEGITEESLKKESSGAGSGS